MRLGAKNLEQYLGAPRFLPDKPVEEGLVGVAVGLAWTANGGAILPVEVVTMPGKGSLMVTGQLGDVMQESSRAALSYIRSRADELELSDDFPNNLDIHIHLPEGAIPKDGPSAGITMAIAMISALTRRPVRHDLAMTGEITLRGRVLPIGGLKEKALAAHRVGIRTVLIPAENMKDLADIPEKIRQAMTFIPVETMDDVIRHALQPAQADGQTGEGLETTGVVERLPIAAESPAQREPERAAAGSAPDARHLASCIVISLSTQQPQHMAGAALIGVSPAILPCDVEKVGYRVDILILVGGNRYVKRAVNDDVITDEDRPAAFQSVWYNAPGDGFDYPLSVLSRISNFLP